MVTIDITEKQIEALKSKAADIDLTIEQWLVALAESDRPLPRRSKYTLEELVAQCDMGAPRSAEDVAWLNDPPRGREAI